MYAQRSSYGFAYEEESDNDGNPFDAYADDDDSSFEDASADVFREVDDDYQPPAHVLAALSNWSAAYSNASVSASSIASLAEEEERAALAASARSFGQVPVDLGHGRWAMVDRARAPFVSSFLSSFAASESASLERRASAYRDRLAAADAASVVSARHDERDNDADNDAEASASSSSVLQDLMRCFICFERVKEPHMCPHCSKICCFGCVSIWLNERREQCPHCRQRLTVGTLVNCRFMDDVTKELERIQSEARSAAAAHHQGGSSAASVPSSSSSASSSSATSAAPALAASSSSSSSAAIELCQEHPHMQLDYYCRSCSVALCAGTKQVVLCVRFHSVLTH